MRGGGGGAQPHIVAEEQPERAWTRSMLLPWLSALLGSKGVAGSILPSAQLYNMACDVPRSQDAALICRVHVKS